MLYEMRIYHSMPGKLPALLARFENTTVALFEKHGFRQIGYWTVAIGEGSGSDLVYMLAWDTLADREAKFAAFGADPEWIEARAKSEADGGPIVASVTNSILTPTSFSQLK